MCTEFHDHIRADIIAIAIVKSVIDDIAFLADNDIS